VDLNPQISIPLPHIPALHKLNTKHPNYKWKALHGTHFMQAKKENKMGKSIWHDVATISDFSLHPKTPPT
jgi:hypothetical protein